MRRFRNKSTRIWKVVFFVSSTLVLMSVSGVVAFADELEVRIRRVPIREPLEPQIPVNNDDPIILDPVGDDDDDRHDHDWSDDFGKSTNELLKWLRSMALLNALR